MDRRDGRQLGRAAPSQEQAAHGLRGFDSLRGDAGACPRREPEPMAPAGIMFTSGTTSRPKAVVHTHANALVGEPTWAR